MTDTLSQELGTEGEEEESSGTQASTYPDVTRCGLLATQVVLVKEGSQLGLEPLQWLEMPVEKHHHIHHGEILAQKRQQGPKETCGQGQKLATSLSADLPTHPGPSPSPHLSNTPTHRSSTFPWLPLPGEDRPRRPHAHQEPHQPQAQRCCWTH